MGFKKQRGSNKNKGLCKLAIDEELTIYAINGLKKEISKIMDIYYRFELDLANVEEIDSAGIQLLLALRNELIRQKKELKLTAMSGAVIKLIEDYGVSERLNKGDAA